MSLSDEEIIRRARDCFDIEIKAMAATRDSMDQRFVTVVRKLQETLNAHGKLVVTGVGKNVPICEKIAGTFNSTGVPTAFLDPNQALHGDLGLCQEGDLCLLLSNSGETEDLLRLIPALKRLGLITVAVTSATNSTMANNCDLLLPFRYEAEACPLNLAPTASTTATLALGDALAMVFLAMRDFSAKDFARYHPAGSLGKSLLLRVNEFMRSSDRFACAPASISVQEAILRITNARCGSIALTDPENGQLVGVFSDGDFRRAALHHPEILTRCVADFMTTQPKTVPSGALAVEALKIFEKSNVNDLIVVDSNRFPIGLVDGQDMPKLRIV